MTYFGFLAILRARTTRRKLETTTALANPQPQPTHGRVAPLRVSPRSRQLRLLGVLPLHGPSLQKSKTIEELMGIELTENELHFNPFPPLQPPGLPDP